MSVNHQCFGSRERYLTVPRGYITSGGSSGIKILQETKQRTCTEEAITGTRTAGSKGELEAQDKGGPRSQETKTVTDKISTRLKYE